MAIPRIANRQYPHDIRFAIAMPPSTMTKIIATGVSQARIFVCRELAPVMNGEACANARSGAQSVAASAAVSTRCASTRVVSSRVGSCDILDLRLQRADFVLAAPCGQFFTLRPPGSAEAEILHYEVI